MTEQVFNGQFSLFLNCENFGDTRQTRDGPIYTGPITNPDFNDIYAPLMRHWMDLWSTAV